jgi:hypothetical protein
MDESDVIDVRLLPAKLSEKKSVIDVRLFIAPRE